MKDLNELPGSKYGGRYDRDRPEYHEENQEILQEELSPTQKTRDNESSGRYH